MAEGAALNLRNYQRVFVDAVRERWVRDGAWKKPAG